jgi:hypothetical protein
VVRNTRCDVLVVLSLLLLLCGLAAGCTRRDGGRPDAAPPAVPGGVAITAMSAAEVRVSWKPSTDDVGVTKYKIYRNGTYLRATEGTTMTDAGLKPQIRYCYRVAACDASGKESAQSADVCAVL